MTNNGLSSIVTENKVECDREFPHSFLKKPTHAMV